MPLAEVQLDGQVSVIGRLSGRVPEKLVRLLEALHEHVNVHLEVQEATVILKSIIGVKQGDLLGPQLFIFHICAIMQTWRKEHNAQYDLCKFRTKMDSVVCSRK